MTNEELATQVLEQLKFGETITPLANDRIYDAALVTALRKDEQLAKERQSLIDKACFLVCANLINTHLFSRESIVEFVVNFRKEMEDTK